MNQLLTHTSLKVTHVRLFYVSVKWCKLSKWCPNPHDNHEYYILNEMLLVYYYIIFLSTKNKVRRLQNVQWPLIRYPWRFTNSFCTSMCRHIYNWNIVDWDVKQQISKQCYLSITWYFSKCIFSKVITITFRRAYMALTMTLSIKFFV